MVVTWFAQRPDRRAACASRRCYQDPWYGQGILQILAENGIKKSSDHIRPMVFSAPLPCIKHPAVKLRYRNCWALCSPICCRWSPRLGLPIIYCSSPPFSWIRPVNKFSQATVTQSLQNRFQDVSLGPRSDTELLHSCQGDRANHLINTWPIKLMCFLHVPCFSKRYDFLMACWCFTWVIPVKLLRFPEKTAHESSPSAVSPSLQGTISAWDVATVA